MHLSSANGELRRTHSTAVRCAGASRCTHDDCDRNRFERDGVPNVLQRTQVGYAALLQYGAPVHQGGPVSCAPALQNMVTVTGMNMIGTAFQMSYNSPMLATLLFSSVLPYSWQVNYGAGFNMTVTGVDMNRGAFQIFCGNRSSDLHLMVFCCSCSTM